jgi:hypothetical protein
MRDTQLCLLAAGGAELIDVDTDVTLWASDSDEDYGEEFPEILDENDVEHLMDYLEEKLDLSARELEVMEIITEPLEGDPGDDDDDDDEGDEADAWNANEEEDDIIDGEVMER